MDAQPLPPAGEAAITRFTEQVFAHLTRVDQRRWARAYLHGLLAAPGRKSLSNLAASLSTSRTAALSLQQFINDSPWDWRPARRALTRVAGQEGPVRAWTATLAVIPKRGDQAVGVHRRFDPSVGRTVKCQVAAGLFIASGREALPVDWSLLLDPSWTEEPQRRARARIPESAGPRPAWQLLVDMVDRLAAHQPPAPLIADLGITEQLPQLAGALARRGIPYLLEARPGQLVRPALQAAAGRLGTGRSGGVEAEALFPRPRLRPGGGPQPTLRGVPVQLPAENGAPVHWLWAHSCHPGGPRRYWLTGLTEEAPGILALIESAASTRGTVDRLGAEFGLRDFSGRSYLGWHHHMTMVSAAYAFGRHSAGRLDRVSRESLSTSA